MHTKRVCSRSHQEPRTCVRLHSHTHTVHAVLSCTEYIYARRRKFSVFGKIRGNSSIGGVASICRCTPFVDKAIGNTHIHTNGTARRVITFPTPTISLARSLYMKIKFYIMHFPIEAGNANSAKLAWLSSQLKYLCVCLLHNVQTAVALATGIHTLLEYQNDWNEWWLVTVDCWH